MTFYDVVVEASDFTLTVSGRAAFDVAHEFLLEVLGNNTQEILYRDHNLSGENVQKMLSRLGCPVEIRKEEDIISVHRSVDCTNLFAKDKEFTLSLHEI
jgi:phenylalanyl-tRNA synthetase beta subunit